MCSAGDACVYPYRLLRQSFLGGLRKLHLRIFYFDILQSNVFCQTKAFLLIFLYIKVCFPLEIWEADNCTTAAGIRVHRVSSVSLCCFIWMGHCEKQLMMYKISESLFVLSDVISIWSWLVKVSRANRLQKNILSVLVEKSFQSSLHAAS